MRVKRWSELDRVDRVELILEAVHQDTGGPRAEMGLLDRLVEACASALPVSGVGLVWMSAAGLEAMLAATDGVARELEELQFLLGEGPSIDSSRLSHPVLSSDLARFGPGRWPEFTAGALDAGICAVFAFPLQVGRIPLGVLDLYRDVPGPLGDAGLAQALAYGDAAISVLLDLQSAAGPAQLHQAFTRPLSMRDQVHQATGMIAVQAGVSLAEALVLLRARSYALGRPVTDLAHEVVARVLRFEPGRT